ncbi:hypothetical protein [Chengkuizengella axinellae]|uniref:Cytochrome C oxidase subunit II n=1 Tax=Chengkuizengella axinellae TaxID=3064388 RepID=A0ABT9IWY8_9BACL|nr:hypothetical protein [Chengkuizengella sp. 2205SS18-9]MDP5273617.1 hypothetical protein [Chengkuizengella sp. 2205SS18-9]
MHKWVMVSLFVIASVLGIAITFTTVGQHEVVEEVEEEGTLVFKAENWKFDKEEYTVELGETLELSLRNVKGVHQLQIEGLDIELLPGEEPVKVNFDEAGTYTIICSLPCGEGHETMASTLIVQ